MSWQCLVCYLPAPSPGEVRVWTCPRCDGRAEGAEIRTPPGVGQAEISSEAVSYGGLPRAAGDAEPYAEK